MFRPSPSSPDYRADIDAIGDAVEAASRRRAEEQRRARGSLLSRLVGAARRNAMQTVPVLVIATLLVAGLTIREAEVPAVAVAGAGALGLGGYWWRFAIGAPHPAVAMLRPTLAVVYLVASAVLG